MAARVCGSSFPKEKKKNLKHFGSLVGLRPVLKIFLSERLQNKFVNSIGEQIPPPNCTEGKTSFPTCEDVNNQITLFTVGVSSYFDRKGSEAGVCLFVALHHVMINVFAPHSCISWLPDFWGSFFFF